MPKKCKLFIKLWTTSIPWQYISHTHTKKKKSPIIRKALRYIYLLASVCGGHQPDLSLPLLLGGSVNGFDQQWSFWERRMLIALGSINYSISFYHKVRWVTAFKMHQTTLFTVKKPHCKRQRNIDLSLEKETKKKNSPGGNDGDNGCKKDWQTNWWSSKVLWFAFFLIHYSLQAVPWRHCSEQVQLRRIGSRKIKFYP